VLSLITPLKKNTLDNVKIIWINGAFGSGKTQTAFELHERLPDSFVYDPENMGYFIYSHIPKETKMPDFQDYTQWRSFNYDMLKYIADNYSGIIIVPMTIVVPQYYDEIIGRLINDGIEVKHIILEASKATIHKRLRKRLDGGRWASQQTDRCIEAFATKIDGIRVNNENMTIKETADFIAAECKIELKDIKRGFIDRIRTQIRHIRWVR
jgi:Uridine kinase